MSLTADQILTAADLETVEVEVKEWGGSVHLRVLPADVGLELSAKMAALPKERQQEALFMLLGACLVNPDGSPIFTTEAQLERLRTRSQKVLMRLQEQTLELQGWGRDGRALAGKGA